MSAFRRGKPMRMRKPFKMKKGSSPFILSGDAHKRCPRAIDPAVMKANILAPLMQLFAGRQKRMAR